MKNQLTILVKVKCEVSKYEKIRENNSLSKIKCRTFNGGRQDLSEISCLFIVADQKLLGFVQGDWSNGRLDSGLGQPGEGHEDLLLGVEAGAEDGDVGSDHADYEGKHQDQDGVAPGL